MPFTGKMLMLECCWVIFNVIKNERLPKQTRSIPYMQQNFMIHLPQFLFITAE